MTPIASIGTYLPPWTVRDRRVKGPDEDALTMAVAAGRAADPDATARRVVLVSRDFPLLEGGNGGVLLAALSLLADTPVAEVLGGAPAVLDQIGSASDGTLVIAADDNDLAAGAGAVLTGDGGATVTPLTRQTRSLPLTARGEDGARHAYVDPRLQREVGVRSTLTRLGLTGNPALAAVAGVPLGQIASDFDTSRALGDPTVSAAAIIRLLADAIDAGTQGLLLAIEQSSISAADFALGGHHAPDRPRRVSGAGVAEVSRCRRRRDSDLDAGVCARIRAEDSLGSSGFRREPGHRLRSPVSAAVAGEQRGAVGDGVPTRAAAANGHGLYPHHGADSSARSTQPVLTGRRSTRRKPGPGAAESHRCTRG